MLALVVTAFCAPASAWWYDDGLPLSDHSNCTVWENLTVENGSLYIGYEGGINPKEYTYHFSVPAGTVIRSHLCIDVWSADWCGQMDFEFNGCGEGCNSSGAEGGKSGDNKPFGTYQFGEDGAGCSDPVCDENRNVAGNGCGGNGIWWNVTNNVTPGATNDFIANRNTTECEMDGRKRGANLVHVYQNTATCNDTLRIWFNQGMEDEPVDTVHIYNVTNTSAKIWTLYVCSDCGDDGDKVTFNGNEFAWNVTNHWMDINSYNVTEYMNATPNGTNSVDFSSIDNYLHPFWTILVGSNYTPPPPTPDLTVLSINTHAERNGQTPIAFVENHNYTIEATIKETGGGNISQSFNVSFYDGATEMEKKTVNCLGPQSETVVSFNWTSNVTVGNHTFTVVADQDDDVDELLENNNASNVSVNVLSAGTIPDIEITSAGIIFLPTYDRHGENNTMNTTIELNISNVNTSDSGAYYADLYVEGNLVDTTSMPSVNAKSWMKHKTFEYNATPGTTYAIEVGLRDVTNETNNGSVSNNATRNLRAIDNVTAKNTHEFGNTSNYIGYLSGGAEVEMFNVTRVVPENTTLYNLLSSVAAVGTGDYKYKAYGIDSLEQDTSNLTYWYAFVNGIPVNDTTERNDLYQLKEGDVAHWDILKYVNSGQELEGEAISFKPRPIMDYPEPFLHGYGGTTWNTTIVYPSNDPGGDYNDTAHDIKASLNQSGVLNETINITTDVDLADTEKTGNHLILLGTPNGNTIIADVNDNHTEVGMPVYFQDNGWLIDDWLDDQAGGCNKEQQHGVVMACDNPFDNAEPWTDTWKDSSQTIWIASGVTDCYAKYAADVLASGNLSDKGFWYTTRNGTGIDDSCGDVNGDCKVTMGDVGNLLNYVGYPSQGQYTPKTSEWAGNVNGIGDVTMGDVANLLNYVGYPGQYQLNCCN